MVNTVAGAKRINPTLLRAAATMGLGRLKTLRTVVVPGALPAVGVGGQVTREDLQRDLPPQPRIFGKKDLAHAALAQQFENLVVPESLPDHFRSFRAMQGCRRMVPSPPTGRSAAWSPYCPIGSLQWT